MSTTSFSFLIFFTVLTSACTHSQTSNGNLSLTFRQIPYDDPDLTAPGRGAEQWHDQNRVNITGDSATAKRLDKYYRFSWKDLETANGEYDWKLFDQEINDAIDNRQKFGFGIMPVYPGGSSTVIVNGATLFYPLYLHERMQSEKVKDWISPISKTWVPNWNSHHYLEALEKLNEAINKHLDTGSYKGRPYRDIINYIDIRGYGSWGEWHNHEIVERMPDHPEGTRATASTLIRIIDAHTKTFADYPLVIIFNVFDCNRLNNTKTPVEVAYHALTTRNNWGPIGWRRDNWGALDDYIRLYTDRNKTVYKEMRFDTAIMNRYKYAPVNGEPIPAGSYTNGCEYNDMEKQVKRYHASSFGNGNFSDHRETCMQENIRAASKAAGYRFILEQGDITKNIVTSQPFFIMLQWKNIGVAPTYEDWDVIFQLQDSVGNTAWFDTSAFKPKLFLPQDKNTPVTDTFILPKGIRPGYYNLQLVIKDPKGYRTPLPLAIMGRNDDGSYTLKTVAISGN
jgi:hypothetical protein